MSFDALAPHYAWMEFLAAGWKLQRCRTAFLHEATGHRRVLIAGEGDGRFLSAFLQRNPQAQVTCVERSARMIQLARERIGNRSGDLDRVEFIQADILAWDPAPGRFDLVVTHFFLDCFTAEQLELVIDRLAKAAAPESCWLLADFQEPEKGLWRWRARTILWVAYRFFRLTTSLPAGRLVCPDAGMRRHGFELTQRGASEWGLLHSDVWKRSRGRNRGGAATAQRENPPN